MARATKRQRRLAPISPDAMAVLEAFIRSPNICGWCERRLRSRRRPTRTVCLPQKPWPFAFDVLVHLRSAGCDIYGLPVHEQSGPNGYVVEIRVCSNACLKAVDTALYLGPLISIPPTARTAAVTQH